MDVYHSKSSIYINITKFIAIKDYDIIPKNYNIGMNIKTINEDSDTKQKYQWIPRVIVIGPGGIKGLKILGFLSPIEDSGLLEYLDTYCGVSVGAVISLLIICGYQIREIVGEAAKLDLFKEIGAFNFKSIIENKG